MVKFILQRAFDLYKVTYLNNPEDDDTFKHQNTEQSEENDEGRFMRYRHKARDSFFKTQEEVNAFWFSSVEPTRTSWQ